MLQGGLTLLDFPFEDRPKLTYWSDMVTNMPGHGPVKSFEHKAQSIFECFGRFEELWNQRLTAEPGIDDLDADPTLGDPGDVVAGGVARRDRGPRGRHLRRPLAGRFSRLGCVAPDR